MSSRIQTCNLLVTNLAHYQLGYGAQYDYLQSLATDACLTAESGVASWIQARSHTLVEIDHVIISTVILLPSADSFKKVCCQLEAKVCAQITQVNRLFKPSQESVVR